MFDTLNQKLTLKSRNVGIVHVATIHLVWYIQFNPFYTLINYIILV